MGTIYHYHPETKVYTGSTPAIPDSADPSKDTIPAHATSISPGSLTPGQYQSLVFSGSGWTVKNNYTGLSLFDKQTALPVENMLQLGDALPSGLTVQDPNQFDYPKWDAATNQWIEDANLKNRDMYVRVEQVAANHYEAAMAILRDNEINKSISGMRVLSAVHESALRAYLVDMQNYLDLVHHTGSVGIMTMTGVEPIWPLPGDPDIFDSSIFDTDYSGPTSGLQAKPWISGTSYGGNELIYDPAGGGLFISVKSFTSNPGVYQDLAAGNMVSVIPAQTGLRHSPVATVADLAALIAADYMICKVLDTGVEYVFHLGSQTGDVPDNNRTGYWVQVASPATNRYLTYTGTVSTIINTIDIGIQPFTVQHELVFVNGSLRVDTEYTVDWTTGIFTLSQDMNPNDNWKVLVMS